MPRPRAIVKLGGSLRASSHLPLWLAAIAESPIPRLIVPGGGPFADAIRDLQPRLGFDDQTAHGMAILAMQQYALYLANIEPRLVGVESPAEIAATAGRGGSAIWLPWAMVGRDPRIEASWRITSDSLALLLAIRLDIPELLLVKMATLPTEVVDLETLAHCGTLDPAFPGLARGYGGRIRLAGAGSLEALADGGLAPLRSGLSDDGEVGTLVRGGGATNGTP